tara:strand:- start:53 stop:484 length:432 start_codon:yes stop_codon:yes gene_type:complete
MATRRRSSAVKSSTAKKSPRTVVTKKTTVTPKSVNKVTLIEEVKVAKTTDIIEVKLPEGTNLKKRPMNSATASKDKVKPEVKLISRDLYLQDVKNRWQIHQFETQQLWEDLVKGYNYVSPYVTKSIEYVTSAYNKQFGIKTSS